MSSDRTHIGHVLWFDQKKGFGFVSKSTRIRFS